MLYDPRWDKDRVHGPVSLRALIAWLETQPADTQYDFCQPYQCVLAQHLQALGYPEDKSNVQLPIGEDDDEADWLNVIAQGNGVAAEDWTFGAALARARAALSSGERSDG